MGRFARPAVLARRLTLQLRTDALVRNNAIFLSGSVAAGAFGYVFHFAVGRLLGPASYGIVASAVAALYLLTLPSLVIQTVSTRFTSVLAAQHDLGPARRLLVRLNAATLIVGVPLALSLLLGRSAVAHFLRIADQRVIVILALSAVVALVLSANRGALQGLRRFGALSTNLVTDMATRVLVGAGLVLAGLGTVGALLGVLVGPGVAYVQSVLLLRELRRARGQGTVSLLAVARYAVPTAVAVIGVTYLFNVDVLLAKHYLSSEAAGIYAAASVLARVVYFIGLTIAGVMFPEVATLHARNEAHFHVVDRSLLFLGAVGALLCAAYFAVPGWIVLPYGQGFAPVGPYLGPFAVALTLLALANLLINYFLSLNSARFIPLLLGACLLETGLITAFHDDPGRILAMVLLTSGALVLLLGGVYAAERRRREAPTPQDRAAPGTPAH
jgi:O-antigen/teichoic acid export membrane protein